MATASFFQNEKDPKLTVSAVKPLAKKNTQWMNCAPTSLQLSLLKQREDHLDRKLDEYQLNLNKNFKYFYRILRYSF